jgi:1-acyl-sn-glycerol-3-phosphate acyltransferase
VFSSQELVAQLILEMAGVDIFVYHEKRIPQETGAVLVVSNHRSFLDAPILLKALRHPLRIACHHYMGKTPLLREVIHLLGCFPFEEREKRQQEFFKQATEFLQSHQWVGLFPEGGNPMLELTQPNKVGEFQRGFAHLALRIPLANFAVLPVAIASTKENVVSPFPIRLLRLLDPAEPLFDRDGLHPVAFYHRVNVLIGRPYWITPHLRQLYQGKGAKRAANDLTHYCHQEIATLLSMNNDYDFLDNSKI